MTAYSQDKEPVGSATELTVVPKYTESRLKNDPKLWADFRKLCDMLAYCRPHSSKTERKFIGKYIGQHRVTFDKKGNAHKIIGDAPVIWSCHTDTVHAKGGIQKLEYWIDEKSGDTYLGLAAKETTSCLGADDTAGVWLMLEMIKAKIPGHYIFHRGEECGGIGSRWIAKEHNAVLKGIKFAIAFDRKDTKSVITHQGGRKCCSDEFADSLIAQLNMGHEKDSGGMWTDTASYVDDIAECTNISIGYYNAHGKTEMLNVDYLLKLRDAVLKIDLDKLIEKRKPGDNAYRYSGTVWTSDDYAGFGGGYVDRYHGWHSPGYHSRGGVWRKRPEGGQTSAELDRLYGNGTWYKWFAWHGDSGYWVPLKNNPPPNSARRQGRVFCSYSELNQMRDMIKDNNGIIADLLDSLGYGPKELKDHIEASGGVVYEPKTLFWGL